MIFSTVFAFVFATVLVSATPTSLTARQTVNVHCGTTDDATLSDCQQLVQPDTWDAAWAGFNNVCHYSNIVYDKIDFPAYNTACHGDCCVYYASGKNDGSDTLDKISVRDRAAGLLGCGDTAANKVNALGVLTTDGSVSASVMEMVAEIASTTATSPPLNLALSIERIVGLPTNII